MGSYADLQPEHQRLLAQRETGGDTPEMIKAAQAYIERARVQAEAIASPRERDQVRANLRFWASYVFDQTGTYPNTTLRPATLPAEAPGIDLAAAEQARPVEVGRDIAGRDMAKSIPSPASTTDRARRPGDVAGRDRAQSLPMARPAKTAWIVMGGLAVIVLLALIGGGAALIALSSGARPTPTAPPTATVPPKPAFNERLLLLAQVSMQDNCDTRDVTVTFDGADVIDLGTLTGMRLRLTESGSGAVVRELRIAPGQAQAEVDLSELGTRTSALYLLHVDQPDNTFSDVILQWGAGCTGNQVTVTYTAQQAYSLLEEEPPRDPDLSIDWWLVNWGPSPLGGRWIAVLGLEARGDSGQYIFWDGDRPLSSPQVLIRGFACEYGQAVIGVTSNGRTYAREVVVLSPHCPPP